MCRRPRLRTNREVLQLKFKVTSDARSPPVPAQLNLRKAADYEDKIAARYIHVSGENGQGRPQALGWMDDARLLDQPFSAVFSMGSGKHRELTRVRVNVVLVSRVLPDGKHSTSLVGVRRDTSDCLLASKNEGNRNAVEADEVVVASI